jgi:hypothetical protein
VDNYRYKSETENDIQECEDDPSLLVSYTADLRKTEIEIKNLEEAEKLR